MPSVMHGEDEFADLLEAASTTENGGTQAYYCISQHMNIVEKDRAKDGGLGACSQKSFSEQHPLERRKTPFWNMG